MKFTFKPSPNYRDSLSTQGIMRDLTIGLLVVFAFSLFHYATGENLGVSYAIRAVGLLATSIISAEVTEAIYFVITKQPVVSSLKNSFGWVTAIILTLMCPINITYYALAVSTILAIFFGKLVFGGFGQNIFNFHDFLPRLVILKHGGAYFVQGYFPKLVKNPPQLRSGNRLRSGGSFL